MIHRKKLLFGKGVLLKNFPMTGLAGKNLRASLRKQSLIMVGKKV
jgi:hypothetical protein